MKVLLTSGFLDEVVRQEAALDPSISFIPKPFTPTELNRRVRALLDKDA
jgi:DNA-binding response OmpR family regulator